jgi:hypothetical protein
MRRNDGMPAISTPKQTNVSKQNMSVSQPFLHFHHKALFAAARGKYFESNNPAVDKALLCPLEARKNVSSRGRFGSMSELALRHPHIPLTLCISADGNYIPKGNM